MKCQNFSCYTKNNNVLSVGMNLNNIIAKHYYSENIMKGGCFRKKLNIPLPLMLLNHENSFLKNTITNNKTVNNQIGGKKNKNNDIISDSLFDKLIDIKSKTNLKQTRKHKKGGAKRKKKKTKKLFIF
tara:strand:- start:725 stop:1108 length:384 start_codon:yes stop_codon:yes gene_type:complete